MSTNNHKAEAEAIAELFDSQVETGTAKELRLGQLHATLYAAEQTAALVQEQELANRIAYAVWCQSMGYITEQPVIETIRKGLSL